MLTYYLCTGHVRTYLDLDGNNTDGDGAIYVSNFWKQATCRRDAGGHSNGT
jgi:hypothetical protein